MDFVTAGERIRKLYDQVIKEYSLESKVTSLVTDNGLNMVKAFKLPDFQSEPEELEESETECSDVELGESDDEESHTIADTTEIPLEAVIPEETIHQLGSVGVHMRCFCHTLQLAVKDGLSCMTKSTKNAIAKSSKIINHSRMSVLASDLIEESGIKKLKAANTTRWNSQLTALESILEIPYALLDRIDGKTTLNT